METQQIGFGIQDGPRRIYSITGIGYREGARLRSAGWEWIRGFKCPGTWSTENPRVFADAVRRVRGTKWYGGIWRMRVGGNFERID